MGEPADLDALERAARRALQPERLVYLDEELQHALRVQLPRLVRELRERRESAARGSLPGGPP